MLKFIKNLIAPEDKKALPIRFEEIPAWLEDRRRAALSRLEQDTKEGRAEIRTSQERLTEVMQVLLAARFNESLHPKLKSIAEKSLPQYVKAMGAALEKDLPDDPGEFYAAAAELLKGCINSARGQGKYLQTAFPEEMKAVSACVAVIGRALNAMNEPISSCRAGLERISDAERIHAALADISVDMTKSQEKEERIVRRIREIGDRISTCVRGIEESERQRREPDLAGQEHNLLLLREERDQTVRRYSVLSMTASHVLRKAENVARRQHKVSEERAVAHAIAILSDHTVPDSTEIASALDAVYIPARRMIDAGEVPLKNKEERALFSSPEAFSNEIRNLCTSYADLTSRCDAAEHAFRSHPVIARHTDLVRERKHLGEMLVKEQQALDALTVWRRELGTRIPALRDELKKKMGEMSGSDVQIHYPDG